MDRTARGIGAGLLLVGTALHAGCGNSASGLTTGATDVPAVTSQDPMARPIQVAWTSARAQRCGFYFDPAKLKASYLSYETRQGAAGEQLGKLQNTYDTTFKSISARVSADPDYCTDKKGTEIKADLQRHLAGDFTPNLPKPKTADPCGFFGCPTSSDPDEKFNAKKMFDDLERKKNG